ncbi:proline iminopeptidase-family hydrolase [Paraburkholderia solisilvae]|nr:proline iminopeptidase-family hydrolase [Paraburkholderia solisilvae]
MLEAMTMTLVSAFYPASFARAAVQPSDENLDGVRWVRLSNGYKVWTRRLGRGSTRVLILNGGPGLSHEYMQCFADFLPAAGYEMYFYDQLGCGQSDKPRDKGLWTLQRYVSEVEEVRSSLGLDQVILVTHSWGAMLGIEYVLRYPENVRAFVLSDMSASYADFARYVHVLRTRMPDKVQARMSALERKGKTDANEYQHLVMQYLYHVYICRSNPWPVSVQHCFAGVNEQIYSTMQGPNEFVVTGNLKEWDRWASLPRISTPTLVMGARYDEMDPASEQREAFAIPHAEFFMSETGSHLAMWDDQQAYFGALMKFLDKHRV